MHCYHKAQKTTLVQINFDLMTTDSSRLSNTDHNDHCILHKSSTARTTGISPTIMPNTNNFLYLW